MRTSGRSPLALFAGGPMLLPQPSGRFAFGAGHDPKNYEGKPVLGRKLPPRDGARSRGLQTSGIQNLTAG